jgi:type IV pilus assembly protein PilX
MYSAQYLAQHSKQDGAVLIFSIILLLVMTLLGLSSLNTSTIQEKVSANSLDYNRVFQAAESAVSTQVAAALARTNSNQLFATENGATVALVPPAGFDADITTTVTVRFEAIPALVDGQGLNADSNSNLIGGRKYVFDATSTIGTADNQTSSTVSQGIDYF